MRRIAATLPLRKDANLASTAITLLTSLAQRGKSGTPEFEAAREAIITHFADVNEYQKRQWKSWKGPFGQRSWTQMDPSCFKSIFGPTQERDKWRVSL